MTTREPNQKYLDTLLLYYEEEVEGEAFFAALAERFDSIDQRRKMNLLAQVENHAAVAIRPLIEKYNLISKSA
jgi:dimethylamine/trimethylamine dehydrogenase